MNNIETIKTEPCRECSIRALIFFDFVGFECLIFHDLTIWTSRPKNFRTFPFQKGGYTLHLHFSRFSFVVFVQFLEY